MDAWPTFWKHNKPLFEKHIADGFLFKNSERTSHFIDSDGNYAPFPVGYITGVGCSLDVGHPHPWHASVYLGDRGWAQRGFGTRDEAIAWAFEHAAQVLGKQSANGFDDEQQSIEGLDFEDDLRDAEASNA